MLVVAAVLAAPSLAAPAPATIDDAFPPTIRVSSPLADTRIERLTLERGDVTWLTIELRPARSFIRELALPIDLPAGTRVIGIQLERDDKVVWGRALVAHAATARYQHADSPALVAWAGSTGDEDHVTVTLRDVTHRGPITVTLALVVPASSNLRVEPWRSLVVDGQRATGPTSLAIAAAEDTARPNAVDARTSLLAEPDIPAIEISIPDQNWFATPTLDKSMIRRRMKTHAPQLRGCYMHVAQWHPEVEGKVELHFTIEDDGHVSDARADGELASDDVKACLARTIAAFEFPAAPGGGRTQINYPLDFILDR